MEKTSLDSGIRILTEVVPGVKSVSLGAWIDCGSRDEGANQFGITHFTEHLLFKGTPRLRARDIAEEFDSIGADVNAFTGREHTSVYSRALSEYLPRVVDLVFEIVRNPLFDPDDVDSERQVILEEINLHNDSPDELVHDHLARALWGKHPISHSVLGDAGVISAVSKDDLVSFHEERYAASRMVIAAAGDVDHEEFCYLVREYEGDIPGGVPAVREDAQENTLGETITFKKDTEQANICIGGNGLPRQHPDRFVLAVMDNILGGSMSSRLFQKIREERGLAYSIYSFTNPFIGMGMVGIYCGTSPDLAKTVMGLIEEELSHAREGGFSAEELERARNHIKGSLYISMEESANRMNRMAKTELSGGEHLTVDEMVERVEAVTLEDLCRVFEETWGKAALSMAVVGPFEVGELALSVHI